MPTYPRLALVTLLIALGPLALRATPGDSELQASSAVNVEIPSILYANWDYIDKAYPTWVSLEAAFTSSGELVEEVFHPHLLRQVQEILKTPTDPKRGCVPIGPVYTSWVNPPDRSSLTKAARQSETVLRGQVLAAAPGFDRGTAGQLFLVHPEEVMEGGSVPSRVLFFMPVGEFQIGERSYCKEDYRFPEPPQVGDEVLLLIPERTGPEEEFLDLQYETSLVVLPEVGGVRVPEIFSKSEGPEAQEQLQSRSDVLQAVASALGATNE